MRTSVSKSYSSKLKLALLFAVAFQSGLGHSVGYDDYPDENPGFDSAQFQIPLFGDGKGLLETTDIAIGTILTSRHFVDENYNETHNGIYLRIDRWSVGTYRNSVYEQSNFIAYNSEVYRQRQLGVELVMGVADGYGEWEQARSEYLPILGLSASWTYLKAMVSYDVLAFGFELPLN